MNDVHPDVAAVRRFNRYYTDIIGALDEGHLDSELALAEVRVLYEIANRTGPSAAELSRDLRIDAGYLSRLLKRFEERGLVVRRPSATDGRQSVLALTDAGVALFGTLDRRAHDDVAALLAPLGEARRRRIVEAMRTIEQGLRPDAPPAAPFILRAHRPGDMGWVVHRQAVLYHREFGWNDQYEALTSRIVADFLDHFDPTLERCWIAERDGELAGCVFVVQHPERPGVAKLRMLYVEPWARGGGLGRRLVSEVTRFAREAGYHTLTLWTNSVLASARRIYEAEGYRLVTEETHHSFGQDLVGQFWELPLRSSDAAPAP